ncbi:MAG: signal peptidase II [Achromobacter pulmonis]|uniref:Lipoprotein signal peptidase n=1 Tax=Achromobacter pulmonis TaxID=1389932 RepID=A0A6S7CK23_9BURK|nr:signal peptidase II [Achromobacter pulmonis]MCF7769726.1 signal peptidase II [Achromobacter pulmonis]MPT27404.1 lipoprotein signal peptidase [Achromobacter sp.]CAB3628890.1 Lipoprotein signal peptidase [Achromobacter pulmonis]CAB3853189.1 Lipoprotein signal peptidase [Achromobacter pulmonis]
MAGPQGSAAAASASAPRARVGRWLAIALAIVVVDQLTKVYFNTSYQYGERLNLLPFFDFTLLYNRGAAFSFLASEEGWQRWLFTGLGVVAAGVILVILRRTRGQPRFCLALAMILGGAIGNVIDRVVYGHVVDFLLFYWRDWYYPAFNVADVGITCGAVLLVLDELLRARKPRV